MMIFLMKNLIKYNDKKRKYLKNGYVLPIPKCRITEEPKKERFYSFFNSNRISTIDSQGIFDEEIEYFMNKYSNNETIKVKK